MDAWVWHRGIRRAMYRDQNVTGRAASARAGALGRERAAGGAAEKRERIPPRRLGVRKWREGQSIEEGGSNEDIAVHWSIGTPRKYKE